MKKYIFAAIMSVAMWLASGAQQIDSWRYHAVFSTDQTNIIDTGDYVYYLSDNCLYRYDKDSEENLFLNKSNLLSDANIANIYYNTDKKYVVVIYSNSNIDFIADDGAVTNLPDLKNAVITSSKNINHVTFAPSCMYVATDFGYIAVNDEKFEVLESRFYKYLYNYTEKVNNVDVEKSEWRDVEVNSVAQVGDHIFISALSRLYYGSVGTHYDSLDEMKSIEFVDGKIYPIGSGKFLYDGGYTHLYTPTWDSNGDLSLAGEDVASASPVSVQRTASGYIANYSKNNFYVTLDENGGNRQTVWNIDNEIFSSQETDGSLWALGKSGIHKVTGSESSTYIRPFALTTSVPFYMTFNAGTGRLLVTGYATNSFFAGNGPATTVDSYDGISWEDVTPQPVIDMGGNYEPIVDPTDAQSYYLPTWLGGLYRITGTEVSAVYNWENSPMRKIMNYYCHPVTAFDKNGNLWVVQDGNSTTPVMMLPKSKVGSASVTASDWVTSSAMADVTANKRSKLGITSSGIKILSNGDYERFIYVWDDGGNPASSSVKSAELDPAKGVIDQDNKELTWKYTLDFAIDQNNRVWVGTNVGVFSFNPAEAFSSSFRVNHTKVPRNDNTNIADYLLDGQQVNCIAVDGNNRKWIGTNSAGLFLVSADGSVILKQFNTSNSLLPSDQVYRICCDNSSNSVFVSTAAGFVEYFSDASAPMPDYSDIIAYPNPVRPEYTGIITIQGLMDNTLVKITDSAGNLVASTKSNGGLATWDGCDMSGKRVDSGVYFVFASQSSTDSGSKAAVTKIVVIN